MATRMPDRRDLVLAALAAGKHVYSERPFGSSSAESDEMAGAAGVRTAIGLQLRHSPALHAVLDRGAAGSIGRILSIRAVSSTAGFGPGVVAPFAYPEDSAAFANLVTIQGAHTLDLVIALGGTVGDRSALLSRQFPDIRMGDEGTPHRRTTFDHMLVQGRFESGAPFGIEVADGRKDRWPFSLEIVGEHGRLQLDGGAPRGLQSDRIGLTANGKRVTIEDGELAGLPDPAVNVGGVYAALRDSIRRGTPGLAGFDHAHRLTRMIETVLNSSHR